MVDEIVENIYLINAPAGSGKTTTIKSMILNHTREFPNDNVLCITYTNRAAEELGTGISNKFIYFSTIHSFLHDFLKTYFSHAQVIDLYFEIYGPEIRRRITNEEANENFLKSNERYVEKYGVLTYETVRQNLKNIYYNESSFNFLYYGGLSHDDLISFSMSVFDKFSIVLKRRLTKKYQLIFIDEYQDSSADVLRIFYDSVYGTSTKLYFLGDKMQQIYTNYNGSFEKKLRTLNKSIALNTNHRSIPQIVDILNNLYNNNFYKQVPYNKNIGISPDHAPRVIICDDIAKNLEIEIASYPKALCLFLLNQKRFDAIGAGNLYKQLREMDRYSFAQQYGPVDVLITDTQDNPDPLFKLLFAVNQIVQNYKTFNLGNIIQLLKKNPKMFDSGVFSVTKHADKIKINNHLKLIVDHYSDGENLNDIESLLGKLQDTGITKKEYVEEIMEGGEYSKILSIKINEFKSLAEYLKSPTISTQHGVKGESHDTVFFIAEDNTRQPIVHMYRFFKLWSSVALSLTNFEAFYYEYLEWIKTIEEYLGFKLSDINAELHREYQPYLTAKIYELVHFFEHNVFFKHLCESDYIDYLEKPLVKTAKKCFKESQVYGPLSAYRLFYVGCSRSRRNLTIFVDKSKIDGFQSQLIKKFKQTGFLVVE